MDFGLSGKRALVLGASRGLGAAIAAALTAEGVTVLGASRAGGYPVDLADSASVAALVEKVRGEGGVDILVNNSGGPKAGPVQGQTSADWLAAFQTMANSLYAITDALLLQMIERKWGRIITVGSSGVVAPIAGLALSNAVRGAIAGWSKTLAGEVARHGITVNMVLPGRIDTDRVRELDLGKASRTGSNVEVVQEASRNEIPAGRYGRPEEFGAVAAFLASQQASYVTGSMIRVDGGMIKGAPSLTHDFDTQIDRRNTGSNKWSKYASDVLPMWVADMDFAAAPPIVDAITQRLRHPVFGYCVARPELREQIVADIAAKYDWKITADDIVFLPGVEPGFNMAIKAVLKPGKTLTIQTPIYRPILMAPRHWGLSQLDFRIDVPVAEQAGTLALADAVLLCNPHNPTGKVYEREDLLALAAATYDKPIISDEIHCELLYNKRRHIPIASLDPAIARRTITLMSAAKTYNIPGLKAAYAIVTDKALREQFNASRLGMVDSVNILGLEASLAAFRDCARWREEAVCYLEGNRDYLFDAVEKRLPGIRMVMPQATYLAWLDCQALGLPDPQAYFINEARVAFSAGSDFGERYGQFVRLNFGCTRATLEEAISRVAQCTVFACGA